MIWQINWSNNISSNKFKPFDFYFGLITTLVVCCGMYFHYFEIGKFYTDSGIFSAVSINLSKGAKLYVDTWENKPPGIFFLFNFLYLFINAKSSIFILGLISHLAIFISLYSIFYLKTKSLITSLPINFIVLFVTFNSKISADALSTEIYGTAILILAILCFEIRKNNKFAFLGLILLGLAPWFKELFLLSSVVIFLIFSKFKLKSILFFLIPTFIILFYFLVIGNLSNFIKMVEFNFFYTQNKVEYSFLEKISSIKSILGKSFIFLNMLMIIISFFLTLKFKDIKILKYLLIFISSFIFIFISPYNLGHYLIPILPFLSISLVYLIDNKDYKFQPIYNISIFIFVVIYSSNFNFKLSSKITALEVDSIEIELQKNKDQTLFIDYAEAAPYYSLAEVKHHAFIPIPLKVHFDDNSYGIKNRERLWENLSKNPPDYLITCHTTSFAYWHLPHNNFYEKNYFKIDSNLNRFPDPVYLWKRKR